MAEQPVIIQQQTSDFKTHFIMVTVFILILGIGIGVSAFCAYKVGQANGKLEGTLTAYTLHPPTVITGPNAHLETITNMAVKPHFGIKVWPPCIGVCP